MSANDLNETMRTLCRNIGKDLVKFNVNVMAVEDIINNGFNKSDDPLTNYGEMELIEEWLKVSYLFLLKVFKRIE